MKYFRVAYLCDGHGCDKNCADTMTKDEWEKYHCHHTTDEAHAKNKIARKRKFKYDSKGMIEI